MFLPSHIASGYLLGKWMKTSPWTVYPFMPVLLLASILPDMDGLFSTTVAGHHSVLHTPIFWIGLFVLMATEGIISKNDKKKSIALALLLGTQVHLVTDWITARTVGIQWMFPSSYKDYFLFPIQPEQGQVPIWEMGQNPYFSFYMENPFLFFGEVGILILASMLYLKERGKHS